MQYPTTVSKAVKWDMFVERAMDSALVVIVIVGIIAIITVIIKLIRK